jgi:uncharacterized membrane protein YhaH (DUF805 family)
VFSGRASRSEFWFFLLFTTIVIFLITLVSGIVFLVMGTEEKTAETYAEGLANLYFFASFIPGLAVSVRRLHDVGFSGWWMLAPLALWLAVMGIIMSFGMTVGWVWILLVLPIGALISLYAIYAIDSQQGPNRFGPSPKGVNALVGQSEAAPPA